MAIFKGSRLIAAFALPVCFSAPSIAEAQDGGPGSIGVRPNLATQSRDGFTVCTGTAQNRALYGSKVTGSTGIVAFPGIPFGTAVVTTVTKSGFTGREQNWLVPAPGSTRDVTIYMFTGSGGPACPGVAAIGGAAPPPPPPTSSVGIIVDPGSAVGRGGFYVCVGTSQNRAAYGNGVTPPSGPLSFANLPAGGMIKATIVRAGYASVERDWYPNPGQSVVLTVPVTTGNGAFTCPGYAAPYAKEIRAAAGNYIQQAEVRFQPPTAPAVRVLDQYANPLAGVSVAFAVTRGGGIVAPASVVSGPDGIASASWGLGPVAGLNMITATMGAAPPVTFSATGFLVPKTIDKVTAVSQDGFAGTPVPEPPGIKVLDRNGIPVPGVKVTFAPREATSGTVAPSMVVTGADGIARLTSWTLGAIPGRHFLVAGATGLSDVGFMANAVLVPVSSVQATISVPRRTTTAGTIQPRPIAEPPARLTAESLQWHGQSGLRSDLLAVLDCSTFGSRYVMVAIDGKKNQAIDKIRVGCSEVVQGGLSNTVRWTPHMGDDNLGSSFESRCADDGAVIGIEGKIDQGQLRSLLLRCRSLTSAGLATGTTSRRTWIGGSGVPWGVDDCTQRRPARALKVGKNVMSIPLVLSSLSPWIIVGAQLICEQPQL